MRWLRLLIAVTLLFVIQLPEIIRAETYSWTTQDGTTHFTDDISKVPVKHRSKVKDNLEEDSDQAYDTDSERVRVTSVTVIEYGVYESKVIGYLPGKIHDGKEITLTEIQLAEKTSKVTAAMGTSIGLTYILNGTPAEGSVDLTVKVISPPINDPIKKKKTKVRSWSVSKTLNVKTYETYKFEMPWELVPGKWTMQILFRGNILASQTFTISL